MICSFCRVSTITRSLSLSVSLICSKRWWLSTCIILSLQWFIFYCSVLFYTDQQTHTHTHTHTLCHTDQAQMWRFLWDVSEKKKKEKWTCIRDFCHVGRREGGRRAVVLFDLPPSRQKDNREGKERKGKERKGKERKGKEFYRLILSYFYFDTQCKRSSWPFADCVALVILYSAWACFNT